MIGNLLDAASRRARSADACVLRDETTSVTETPSGHETAQLATLRAHLRIEDGGRRGVACRDEVDVGALVASALESLRSGPAGALPMPLPASSSTVVTSEPAAAGLDVAGLCALAEGLHARIERGDREVRTWAERSLGRVDVANSRGVLAGYNSTVVGLGLTVTSRRGVRAPALRLHYSGAGVPGDQDLADLADQVEVMLAPPLLDDQPPVPPCPVWLAPRALARLLIPLRQALLAHGVWSAYGPFAGRVGELVVSADITLSDDPLAPARPGSRPVDDDGVVCSRRTLIERGVLKGALVDLEAASRFGVPSTGHGRRSGGARPWIGWSNVVLEPGEATPSDLAHAAKGGVLIRDLPMPAGNVVEGRMTWTTPWAYRLEGGQVVGRYERFVLRGPVYDLLNRVLAVGKDVRWIGAQQLPDVVMDGLTV